MLMLVAFVAPSAAFSQVLYGSLTGSVADQNGAVVRGVKVEAHNVGTGLSKETTTDESGGYQFSALQPGDYRVTFTSASFKSLIQENVSVEANSSRRLDAQLQVAGVSGSVLITDQSPPLQTDRADVNTQLQANQIADLPISSAGSGRNFQGLYKIIPGFSAVTEGVSSAGGNPHPSITANANAHSIQPNLPHINIHPNPS